MSYALIRNIDNSGWINPMLFYFNLDPKLLPDKLISKGEIWL